MISIDHLSSSHSLLKVPKMVNARLDFGWLNGITFQMDHFSSSDSLFKLPKMINAQMASTHLLQQIRTHIF